MAADIIGFNLDSLALSGAAVHSIQWQRSCSASSQNVDFAMVNGARAVEDGGLLNHDISQIVHMHNLAAEQLIQRAGLA